MFDRPDKRIKLLEPSSQPSPARGKDRCGSERRFTQFRLLDHRPTHHPEGCPNRCGKNLFLTTPVLGVDDTSNVGLYVRPKSSFAACVPERTVKDSSSCSPLGLLLASSLDYLFEVGIFPPIL
eukprot:1859557-Amphidinium_carterae.2